MTPKQKHEAFELAKQDLSKSYKSVTKVESLHTDDTYDFYSDPQLKQ